LASVFFQPNLYFALILHNILLTISTLSLHFESAGRFLLRHATKHPSQVCYIIPHHFKGLHGAYILFHGLDSVEISLIGFYAGDFAFYVVEFCFNGFIHHACDSCVD
jgi:hypothetical protein